MTNINIPEEEMQALVGKAILDSLSEDTRNTLIASAIQYLNEVPKRYGSPEGDSPLVAAFKQAIQLVANQTAIEVVREHALPALKDEWAAMLDAAPDTWDIGEATKVQVMGLIFDDMRNKAGRR